MIGQTAGLGVPSERCKGKMQLATLLHRVMADVPAMVVDADQTAIELFLSNGIESAGDGFGPMGLASVAGTFQGA